MQKGALSVAAVVGAVALLAGSGAAAPDAIDRYAAAFIARYRIPGLSLSVVHNGRTVKAQGYGLANLELRTPATKDTVYEIGSITKQFTTEAAMLLVEEGKLGLDDRLADRLPGTPQAWNGITLRQLLGHTSGLKDWEAAGALSYRREYTAEEYITLIASLPPDFAPGDRWAYTNSTYPLLGLVIERAAREPFETFVARRIFTPAGMTATRFKHEGELVVGRSGGYVEQDGEFRNGEPLRPRIIAPNGGIMSTVVDMARWDLALRANRVLTRASQGITWTPVRLNNGSGGSSGLSWFPNAFRGHRMLIHNGSTIAGFSSVVYRYVDDGLTVVVLCNIDRSNAVNVIAQHVAGLVVPGISTSSLPERPDPDPALTSALRRFLEELAAGRDPAMLDASLRVGQAWRERIGRHLAGLVRTAFLDREDFGVEGRERFGSRIRWIDRYKLVTKGGIVYYTFELTADRRIPRFYSEED